MKRFFLAILCLCLVFTISGCSFTFGRRTTTEGGIGDTMTNTFFAYSVDKVYLSDSYGGKAPETGCVFLVAQITVTNLYGESLPMWSNDFEVHWSSAEDDYNFPIEKFTDEQMKDKFTMKDGEKITKICVFEVPAPKSEQKYSIAYLEYFDDNTEGDIFIVTFSLGGNSLTASNSIDI